MLKILAKVYPLFDHLYIYQNLEYSSKDFFKWFVHHSFARDLQRKHKLELTSKALLLALITTVLIIKASLLSSLLLFLPQFSKPTYGNIFILAAENRLFTLSILAFFVFYSFFSPCFLIISRFILWPFEIYIKNKIIKKAKEKLEKIPNLKIIAITGSFAKTSTKNMIYTLLWKNFRVVKTPKSYNNLISISQTILEDIKDNTQVLICEVGAYKVGEIDKVVKFLKPQIGIITAIAPQHLERFGSLENIAKAKFELVEGLAQDNLAVLNSQSPLLKQMAADAKCKVVFYGSATDPIFTTSIDLTVKGTSFVLHTPKGHVLINIPLIGVHHVQNFLAASSVALSFGLSLNEIKQRALKLLPTPHRLEIRKEGSLTIIDNSYNTNPDSSKISFKLLKDYPGDFRVIITPGLIEMGKQTKEENIQFAKSASQVADEIIIVGQNSKDYLLEGLDQIEFPKDKTHLVRSLNEAMQKLSLIAKPKTVVLIENDLPDQYF